MNEQQRLLQQIQEQMARVQQVARDQGYNVPAPSSSGSSSSSRSSSSSGSGQSNSSTTSSRGSVRPPTQNLEPGMTGNAVLQLQNYLVSRGYMSQAQVNTGPGEYGPQTTRAVTAFQRDHGVDNSTGVGFWGPRTIDAANTSLGGGSNQSQPQREPERESGGNQDPWDDYLNDFEGRLRADQEAMNQTGGTPYTMGDYSLIRFAGEGPRGVMNDQTLWLLDPSTKTIRPFQNMNSVRNFFDGEIDPRSIQVVSAAELMPGGLLGPQNGQAGYELLSNEYSIRPDGTARKLDYSSSQLATRYGNGINADLEEESWLMLKGMLTQFEQGGISSQAISDIRNDDTRLAYYINAMTYGGYSITDIYKDMKARELGKELSPISATATKAQYRTMDDYAQATNDPDIQPPDMIGNLDMAGLSDLAIYNLPEEAFKTLIPIMDYDSPEFKEAMDAVETSYYDLLETQLNAATEQEKAIADNQWNQFREDLQKNFGIALSDNAVQAWPQIEAAFNQFAQQGTFGTGLMNETIDDYLRSVRRSDQRIRDEQMDNKEKEEMNYFRSFATSEQINELVASDPDKAARWGLTPSAETLANLDLATLKERYPNAKEDDLRLYISTILDENGNYRSNLYQRQMGSMIDFANPNLQTGLGIQTSREDFQRNEALRKSLLEEERAYREFTTPDVAFLRNVDRDDSATQGLMGNSGRRDLEDFSNRISQAGQGLNNERIQSRQPQNELDVDSIMSGIRGELENRYETSAPTQSSGSSQSFNVTGAGSEYRPTTSTSPSQGAGSTGSGSVGGGSSWGVSSSPSSSPKPMVPTSVTAAISNLNPSKSSGSPGGGGGGGGWGTTGNTGVLTSTFGNIGSGVKKTAGNLWNRFTSLF